MSEASQRRQAEYIRSRLRREARLAENLTPERAFFLVRRRIEWLNHKIELASAGGAGKSTLYFEEREALLWMLDKIKELSEKLLAVEPRIVGGPTVILGLATTDATASRPSAGLETRT